MAYIPSSAGAFGDPHPNLDRVSLAARDSLGGSSRHFWHAGL
jgi:hypothetical protein